MIYRRQIAIAAMMAAMMLPAASLNAQDTGKYPDFSGQWKRPPGAGIQWDQTKRPGLTQQAPLIPEYQKIFEASIADQALGGQGENIRVNCTTNGMPRVMTVIRPIEFVVSPKITYVIFESYMPRRIYTDGRTFPADEEPSFIGYSIGNWIDQDGDGRYDLLEVETRNFKGPRNLEATGLPLHRDNETVVKERFQLDKANKDTLLNEITVIDNAFTRPWTITKRYIRETDKVLWKEDECGENNNHILIGRDNYFLSADGYLMPTRKGQKPPDTRYFK
ncbi:MAG TPA: hypothetical protein VK148_19460 [Xanthobacteraceae bacterium]|jgi:hypothetical protein|nr:hypothetical protein [Xanthobacteraceae bacterium]